MPSMPIQFPVARAQTPPMKSALLSLPSRCVRLLQRATRLEKSVLASIVFAATALFGFAELADDVSEGDTHELDAMILLALRDADDLSDPWGPSWLEEAMRDVTALGSTVVLSAIALSVAGMFLLTRRRMIAFLILATVGGGIAVSNLLKMSFERPRPDLVPHLSTVHSLSFPSGHAMMSAVVYLTLGALLARVYPDVRVKAYLLGLATLATVAVGISRVYLGVHWPTDVLAGWAVGAAWATCCWLLMLWLQSRNHHANARFDHLRD